MIGMKTQSIPVARLPQYAVPEVTDRARWAPVIAAMVARFGRRDADNTAADAAAIRANATEVIAEMAGQLRATGAAQIASDDHAYLLWALARQSGMRTPDLNALRAQLQLGTRDPEVVLS